MYKLFEVDISILLVIVMLAICVYSTVKGIFKKEYKNPALLFTRYTFKGDYARYIAFIDLLHLPLFFSLFWLYSRGEVDTSYLVLIIALFVILNIFRAFLVRTYKHPYKGK